MTTVVLNLFITVINICDDANKKERKKGKTRKRENTDESSSGCSTEYNK